MAYVINLTNGGSLVTVEDGTIDQSTSLKLVGKNYAGYGEIQNENFIHLLENFSSANQPAGPLSGQIWFDSSVKKLSSTMEQNSEQQVAQKLLLHNQLD